MYFELLDQNEEFEYEFQGEFVCVKIFVEVMDVYILCVWFESEGICCYIRNEYLLMMDLFYLNVVGGVQFWVFYFQLFVVFVVLVEIEDELYMNDVGEIIVCLDCFFI